MISESFRSEILAGTHPAASPSRPLPRKTGEGIETRGQQESTTAPGNDRTRPFLQRRPMTDVRTDGQRKRVFIRTYGCQMNVYDSDRMADVLRPLGYAMADTPEQADLVVLNTCHIREHASEKVYSELGRLRDAKRERRAEGRDLTIAVARLRRPGRGRGDRAPPARRRHRRGPAGLPPPARASGRGRAQGRDPPRRQAPAGRRRARHRLPGREQVRSPAGAAGRARRLGLPVDPGRLRQVLHLLRRALYARRRVFAAGVGGAERSAPARGGRRDRDHAARPERQRLPRRGAPTLDDGVDLVAGAADPCAGRDRWRARASATRPPIRATWTTS